MDAECRFCIVGPARRWKSSRRDSFTDRCAEPGQSQFCLPWSPSQLRAPRPRLPSAGSSASTTGREGRQEEPEPDGQGQRRHGAQGPLLELDRGPEGNLRVGGDRRSGRQPRGPRHLDAPSGLRLAPVRHQAAERPAGRVGAQAKAVPQVPHPGREALRKGRHLLDGAEALPQAASRQAAAADRELADLERAEPRQVLRPPPVGAQVRDPGQERPPRDPRCGPQGERDPRRDVRTRAPFGESSTASIASAGSSDRSTPSRSTRMPRASSRWERRSSGSAA